MLSPDNKRKETYKTELARTLELNPAFGELKYRYKLMLWLLMKEWSNTLGKIEKEVMMKILKDAIYIDRKIRKETEGEEEELKEILSQDFQIRELGVEVGTRELKIN